MSSFDNPKELRFVITLQTGTFGSSSNNQITLEGFRASVTIDKGGGQQMGTLHAQIYGVSQSDMNSATTLQFRPDFQLKNTIQVYAIDGAQETLVFSGWIVNAWGNYQAIPDVFLEIQANSALVPLLAPMAPTSYKGQIDVATAISKLAANLGFTFENNGVNVQLSNIYLANTGMEQVKKLAQMAGIWWVLDNTTLAIMPPNTARGGTIPQISSTSSLMGYPTFDGVGLNFQSLFNPSIKFMGKINLMSSITRLNGNWLVTGVAHRLESKKRDGMWHSTIRCNGNGLVSPS